MNYQFNYYCISLCTLCIDTPAQFVCPSSFRRASSKGKKTLRMLSSINICKIRTQNQFRLQFVSEIKYRRPLYCVNIKDVIFLSTRAYSFQCAVKLKTRFILKKKKIFRILKVILRFSNQLGVGSDKEQREIADEKKCKTGLTQTSGTQKEEKYGREGCSLNRFPRDALTL